MSSGGESIASGMIFVLPAILLIGSKASFLGFVVGVGGVLFGIAIASLVYNYLIVEEHGKLMYPESMAISETLVASEAAGESLKYMGIGFGISGVITIITGSFLNVANNVITLVIIILGVVMGIVLFFLNLPIMTVAIGFYLPISTTSIILVGALIRSLVERTSASEREKEVKVSNGISLSSGLVAGGSIIGLIGIILQVLNVIKGSEPSGFANSNGMAFIILVALVIATIIPIITSKAKDAK